MDHADRLSGCLLGTAVGDSIGLVAEGLSRRRIARRWPGPLRQCLLFGRGLVSDDTEHAFLTAQCLAAHGQDVDAFRRALGWRLRWWFVGLPAGVGLATLRACLRLWCGVPTTRSGVWSAGNGAAMRAAIIGAYVADDQARRREMLAASTMITHRDPKAFTAALAIAETAAVLVHGADVDVWELWSRCGDDADWQRIMATLRQCVATGGTLAACAEAIGCSEGISGYAYHSVPLALAAWLLHRSDARAGLEALVRCGGDTDSTAAIAGALYGVDAGPSALPGDWLAGICDRPLSPELLRRLGAALAQGRGPVRWWWPMQPLRNLAFIVTVLVHGFRRLIN